PLPAPHLGAPTDWPVACLACWGDEADRPRLLASRRRRARNELDAQQVSDPVHSSRWSKEGTHAGPGFRRSHCPVLRRVARLRVGVRQGHGEGVMATEYVLSGLMTLFLLVYLVAALLRPERF